MTRKKKTPDKTDQILDELLEGVKNPEDITGENGLIKQLTQKLLNRALEGELTNHLGYEKKSPQGNHSGNSRNGKTKKKVITDNGEIDIDVPRDRNGEFDPQIVKKHQSRFTGFDDKIISMYARGMSTREITGHLKEIYGVDVSPDLISNVTDSVIDEVKEWQNRPLDPVYPFLFLDALYIKIRDNGHVKNKAVYLAIGVNMDGLKEVLGIWIEQTEGAKFWLNILTEIKNRGVQDILVASVDGLKGLPEAIESIFPETEVQLCIVHMVRNSLKYVSFKDRKNLASDLKNIYRSGTVESAEMALKTFCEKWDEKYPAIGKSWKENWVPLTTFFAYPPQIRKMIYTTNAIESLNMSLRKIIKNRSLFPNDEAIYKILYLALRNISKKWTMPARDWGQTIHQLSIMFESRISI